MMPRSMRLLYSVTLSLVSRRGRASTLATAWSPAFFSCSYVSQRTHHTSLPPIIPSSFAPTRASFGGGSVSLFHHSSSTTTTNDSNGDSKNENKKKLVGPAVQRSNHQGPTTTRTGLFPMPLLQVNTQETVVEP